MKTDIILSYVDCSDINWQKLHKSLYPESKIDTERFLPDGTLKYVFRGIEKNMPWVNQIHLIVKMESLLPSWLNREKIHIVYEEEFIPKEFLPTFNSICIEQFMHLIPGLSETFIYMNDDMYPVNKIELSDFFDIETKTPKFRNAPLKLSNSDYCCYCKNAITLVRNYLNLPIKFLGSIDLPYHNMHPHNTELYKEVIDIFKKFIYKYDTFPKRNRQMANYLPFYYGLYTNKIIPNGVEESFLHLNTRSALNTVKKYLSNSKVMCVNDVKDDLKEDFKSLLNQKFPLPSKFEKEYIVDVNIKTMVCCIAKQENHYIREFVEHYKSLGFNNVIIYDNNDIEGETINEVILDYIDCGYVILRDVRGKKGKTQWRKNYYSIQIDSYNEAYKEFSDKCDWILFVDIDEFLMLEYNDTILELLMNPIYQNYNAIKFSWKYYDDNDLINVNNSDYSLVKRFTRHNKHSSENRMCKLIVKTNMGFEINSAHAFQTTNYMQSKNKDLKVCNSGGEKLILLDCFSSGSKRYDNAWINHYRYKTIEEYIVKMKRLWPDNYLNSGKNFLTLDNFFSCNLLNEDKLKYIKKLLGDDFLSNKKPIKILNKIYINETIHDHFYKEEKHIKKKGNPKSIKDKKIIEIKDKKSPTNIESNNIKIKPVEFWETELFLLDPIIAPNSSEICEGFRATKYTK